MVLLLRHVGAAGLAFANEPSLPVQARLFRMAVAAVLVNTHGGVIHKHWLVTVCIATCRNVGHEQRRVVDGMRLAAVLVGLSARALACRQEAFRVTLGSEVHVGLSIGERL